MDVRSVDERSAEWENAFPTYRVYFFDNPYGGGQSWTTYTYEVTGAYNVQQVLAWADANSRGRIYCVYAVVFKGGVRTDPDEKVGLIQLSGWDPNSPGSPRADPPSQFVPEPETGVAHLTRSRKDAREQASRNRRYGSS
jgi:hypothetical protein